MKHNYQGRENASFELLAPGDYVLTVESSVEKTSKSSGLAMLEVKYVVDGHPGIKITDYLVDGKARVDTFITAFNVNCDVGDEIDLNPDTIKGRRGWALVWNEPQDSIDEKTGAPKLRNKVKIYHTDKEKLPRLVEVDPFA